VFGASGALCQGDGARELRRLAVRGAAATVTAQALMLAAQLVSTVVLARLLTPADFGVVGMVTTLGFLLMSFGGNGFNEAIIQRDRMDHHLASNLLWINVAVGLVLAAGFAASGSLLARFYRNPLVAHVAVGFSVGIFIAAASVVHLALLRRAMRFTAVAVNDLVGRAANTAVSIFLALHGWGYWALVAGIITQGLSSAVGAFWLCRWIPGLPRRAVGTRAILGFAASLYGRFAATYLARNLDNALVGWRFDAQALGFYRKAYDLFALPAGQFLAPLTSVSVAALSRVREDLAQFRRYLLDAAGITAFLGLGLGTVCALTGSDVIRVILGPGWERAGRIFAYFGPGMGIMFLSGTAGWIHLSIGRPERWLRWSIFECGFTLLLFILGLRWGPEGVALAWTASICFLVLPALWYAGKPIGLGPALFVGAVWRYIAASAAAGITSHALASLIFPLVPATGEVGALIRVMAASTVFTLLYLIGVVLLHGGIDPLRRLKHLASDAVRVKRGSPALARGAVRTGANAAFALPVETVSVSDDGSNDANSY